MKITVDSLWDKPKDKAGVCCGIEDFFYGSPQYEKNAICCSSGMTSRLKVNIG
jgi:hypothetical protein